MSVVRVTNSVELEAAIKNAKPGNTISLSASDEKYSVSAWNADVVSYDPPVTITSEDPNNQAVIDQMILTRMDGVVIQGVTFSGALRASLNYNSEDLILKQCANITVQDCTFEGQADGYGTRPEGTEFVGGAIYLLGSENVTIADCDISHYLRGISHRNNTTVAITGNSFHDIQEDGIRGGGVNGLLIEDNTFTQWLGIDISWLHADFIQLWTHSTDRRTENVTIRHNFFDGQGEDGANAHQAIFARNDEVDLWGGDLDTWAFRNFVVENNIIDIDFQGGVKLSFVEGLLVTNNTILGEGRIQITSSEAVTISSNIASGLDDKDLPAAVIENNVILQSLLLGQPDYYDAVIANLEQFRATGDVANLMLREGSIADSADGTIGADIFSFTAETGGVHLVVLASPFDYATPLSTDYTLMVTDGMGNAIDLSGYDITWHFEDGSFATGASTSFDYAARGNHAVSVEIVRDGLAVGAAATVTRQPAALLFDLDIEDGTAADASSYGSVLSVGSSLLVEDAETGMWSIDMPDTGTVALPTGTPMSLLPQASIEFGFRIDPENTAVGTILNKTSWLQVNLRNTGELLFKIINPETGVAVNYFTAGADVTDGEWHHIAISFDSLQEKAAAIYLDGVLETSVAVDWTLPNRDDAFTFGNRSGDNIHMQIADLQVSSESWSAEDVQEHLAAFEQEARAIPPEDPGIAPVVQMPDTFLFAMGTENGILVDETDLGGKVTTLSGDEIASTDGTFEISSDHVVVVDAGTDLQGDEALTISFCYQRDAADGDIGALFKKQGWFQLNLRDNGEMLLKLLNTGEGTGVTNLFSKGAALNDADWHHVAVVIDAETTDTASFYIDGVLQGTAAYRALVDDAHNDFMFGSEWVGTAQSSVNGLEIDNSAWDAETVQQDYAAMLASDTLMF
ncbi:LamG-like jellyroll fold domain-containing protein [Mangrovicoccus sp. HB161399]|uniref:LamG-like jellyroll fold domain-containing protein n=1 Tax=Mangrovicoccus sp. HB161399 TaxID=2720392 RepID=UPI001557FB90|nr:LamG-like jellyroll fold domain-containing protein [Mangrovicoccus sp. HB161399]